jgi:hypothetical protein
MANAGVLAVAGARLPQRDARDCFRERERIYKQTVPRRPASDPSLSAAEELLYWWWSPQAKASNMRRGMAIALGVLAGGLLGAVARPAVVYFFCLRNAEVELSQGIMFYSAGFGFVVGVLAVLISILLRDAVTSAVVGALVGACLAYVVTAITFLPLFFAGLLGVNGLEFKEDPWLYGLAMALAGAVAGGVGAWLQNWLSGPPTSPISLPRP